ncbi:MAG TPA: pectinesterase family protein [Opitutaceae bacterium]|nr:pectinesterase family protein [Opitutaceae bacterium]
MNTPSSPRVVSLLLALSIAPVAAAAGSAPTKFFPVSNSANICPDTPLRLTFASAPTLGASGKIQIFDAASKAVVDTIDVSSPTATKTIGGLPDYKYYPVIITDNEAVIYPRNNILEYNKTYYVTIDPGVFKVGADSYGGVSQPASWRFTTKREAPAAGTTDLTVDAEGSGDFCSVQGALDFIPDGNTTPTTILIREGTYNEIIFFTNKHSITIQGEDRRRTIIAYANNANFNASGGNPFAGAAPNPSSAAPRQGGSIYRRGMILAHRVNDLTIANITLRNTTPHGGSQAEALILNGTPEAHAVLRNVDLYSFQDTLQINGQAYINTCYIEGDVDFLWGTGPCFFEDCSIHSVRSNAYYTQIRNPPTNHGYGFFHCTFDGASGVTGNYLSRIAPGRFPASEVVLIDCVMGASVAPVGWLLEKNPNAPNDPVAPAQIHFWEFHSHSEAGAPVDTSQRLAGSRQLKQPDDAALIRDYSNPTFFLGHDWNPKQAAVFNH